MSDSKRRRDRAAANGDGLVVPSAPKSIAVVRRYAVDACVALGCVDAADSVELLVSEVATNAVLHADGSEIRVRILDQGDHLRVEVFDGSPALPVPRCADASAEGGRGLALVEALAARWGVDARLGGKICWFEVGL